MWVWVHDGNDNRVKVNIILQKLRGKVASTPIDVGRFTFWLKRLKFMKGVREYPKMFGALFYDLFGFLFSIYFVLFHG